MCWLVNLVDCLDHIHGMTPKLLEQHEWCSYQKKNEIFSSYNNVQYYCFQSAEIKENGGNFSDNYY